MFLSACIELLFADGGRADFSTRIAAAAAAGIPSIEFWGWRTKDTSAIGAAVRSNDVTITSFLADPPERLVDPTTHDAFLRALPDSCRLANELAARTLIVLAGDRLPDAIEEEQRKRLVDVLGRAAEIAAQYDVTLALEPLNTRIDHRNYFLDNTDDAISIVREVSSPHLRLLYDIYHSVTMGENVDDVLKRAGALIGHVHVADFPGRHEPGTGEIDWSRALGAVGRCGYDGAIGLEYLPTGDMPQALRVIRRALGDHDQRLRPRPSHALGERYERTSR
jgi:hydroxypyruvate isomerase